MDDDGELYPPSPLASPGGSHDGSPRFARQDKAKRREAPARPLVVTREAVRAIMTVDRCAARARCWPLLGPAELEKWVARLAECNLGELVHALPFVERFDVHLDLRSESVLSRLASEHEYARDLLEIGGANVMFGGGSVVMALRLTPDAYSVGDLDVFIVGLETPEQEEALLQKLLDFLVSKNSQERKTILTRTRFQITVCFSPADDDEFDSRPDIYQFILQRYTSPNQALGSTDVQCCGVGLVGGGVGLVATEIAAFCLGASINIVDPRRGNAPYESRLMKYLGRGFAVVVPQTGPMPVKGAFVKMGQFLVQAVVARDEDGARDGFEQKPSGRILVAGRGVRLHGPAGRAHPIEARDEKKMSTTLRLDINWGREADISTYSGPAALDAGIFFNLEMCGSPFTRRILQTSSSVAGIMRFPNALGLDNPESLYSVLRSTLLEQSMHASLGVLYRFLGPEVALEMTKAIFYNDEEKKERIVKDAAERARNILEESQKMDPEVFVPFEQGCFLPTPRTNAEFFGFPTTRVEVGLPDDFYVVIVQLRRQHTGFMSLPKDVLRLLIQSYIIPMHADHTMRKFLN